MDAEAETKRVVTSIIGSPMDFISLHKFAMLMFVNVIIFLLAKLRGTQLITIEVHPRRMAKIIRDKLT